MTGDLQLEEFFHSVSKKTCNVLGGAYKNAMRNTETEDLADIFKLESSTPLADPRSRFIWKNWDVVQESDEYKECVDYAKNESDISTKYHFPEEIEKDELFHEFEFSYILKQFLIDLCLFGEHSINFTSEEFDSIYIRYEEDLLNDSIKSSTKIALQGLVLDEKIDSVSFSDQKEIRELNFWDKRDFTRGYFPESVFLENNEGFSPGPGPTFDYVFEIRETVEKSEIISGGAVHHIESEEFKKFITSLRLAKEQETVNFGSIISTGPGVWTTGGGGSYSLGDPIVWTGKYHLGLEDIGNIKEIYAVVEELDFSDVHKDLRMAISQFNSGTIRSDDRVALSDMVIVLEGLVGSKSDSNLSRNQLAQRVAIVLGNSQDERDQLFSDVRNIYDERNAVWGVAHGGGKENYQGETIERSKEIASNLIYQYLVLIQSYGSVSQLRKDMIETIEAGMLNVEFP